MVAERLVGDQQQLGLEFAEVARPATLAPPRVEENEVTIVEIDEDACIVKIKRRASKDPLLGSGFIGNPKDDHGGALCAWFECMSAPIIAHGDA